MCRGIHHVSIKFDKILFSCVQTMARIHPYGCLDLCREEIATLKASLRDEESEVSTGNLREFRSTIGWVMDTLSRVQIRSVTQLTRMPPRYGDEFEKILAEHHHVMAETCELYRKVASLLKPIERAECKQLEW